jgi:hypothetical protein
MVDRTAVIYSVLLYILSWIGYYCMSLYNQGLELESSKDMFIFSIAESMFLVSMALGYFYSW